MEKTTWELSQMSIYPLIFVIVTYSSIGECLSWVSYSAQCRNSANLQSCERNFQSWHWPSPALGRFRGSCPRRMSSVLLTRSVTSDSLSWLSNLHYIYVSSQYESWKCNKCHSLSLAWVTLLHASIWLVSHNILVQGHVSLIPKLPRGPGSGSLHAQCKANCVKIVPV